MSAFAISEVELPDEDAAAHDRERAAASMAAYGGRYLARARRLSYLKAPRGAIVS